LPSESDPALPEFLNERVFIKQLIQPKPKLTMDFNTSANHST